VDASKIVEWVRALNSPLRSGAWVEVKTKQEILATLDANGTLDGLPFLPEMFEECGKRYRVWRRAHKTCDTVNRSGGRRVERAVHLEDNRCSGAAHGGCDTACLIFWKEAWLTRISGPDAPAPSREPVGAGCSEQAVWAGARAPGSTEADPTYRCQATELPKYTRPLKWWDVRQYVEDLTSGNVPAHELLSGAAYVVFHDVALRVGRRLGVREELVEAYDKLQGRRGGVPFPRKRGTVRAGERTPLIKLGLKPGSQVRVKPYDQILATLDCDNKNRGLFFDAEEVPYCGGTFKVRSRVNRIVDERTGKMIDMKGNAVILDDVYCKGHYSNRRMHCPRAIYPFWREGWLEPLTPQSVAPVAEPQRYSEFPRAVNAHGQSTFPPPAGEPELEAGRPALDNGAQLRQPPPFRDPTE
jgi:hypothetical protein